MTFYLYYSCSATNFPSLNIMLEAILHDVPLAMNTRVPFPPKKSPRYQMIERLMLVHKEEEAQKTEGKGVRALKRRRRRQEASPINIESSERT